MITRASASFTPKRKSVSEVNLGQLPTNSTKREYALEPILPVTK